MILILTIYYLASHGTQALPIQYIDKSAQSCRDLGHCRTIWDIIWSCVVIIFSCTWLAIHPNIPSQEEGKGWRFLRRVGMLISAVIVPELMVLWAMNQWWAAHKLKKKYQNFKWTQTHGFFAVMGGFMLYEDDAPQSTLDPWKLKSYLESGKIKITEGEIRDKSKGDILTKGFVVLQTTWFIIQLIARGVKHLPVTEFEIATLGFACLNFVTYGVWLNKPLNVEFPVRVYDRHTGPSVGDATEGSSGEGEMVDGTIENFSWSFKLAMLFILKKARSFKLATLFVLKKIWSFKSTTLFVLKKIQDAFQPPADSFPFKLWGKYPPGLQSLLFPFRLIAGPIHDPRLKKGAKRVPTFYSGSIDGYVDKYASTILLIPMTLVTVLFGGIHCIAWGFHFPTHAEQIIWRVSSIFITTAPASLLIGLVITVAAKFLFGLSDRNIIRIFEVIKNPMIISFILYPLIRLILLIQALMILRSLPPDAYTTVQWTTFIPHI